MSKKLLVPVLLSLGLVSVCGGQSQSSKSEPRHDWPHWRGPERNGISSVHSGWDGNWSPKKTWSWQSGEGSSSPIVFKGRLYDLSWKSGNDQLVCLDAFSGQALWKQEYRSPRYGRLATGDQGIYSGPSSTPEIDTNTGLLYSLSSDGELRCWNTRREGELVWSLNLHQKFKIQRRPKVGRSGLRDYGFTSSPLVFNDWLLVEAGADEGNLVALEKRTGRLVWTSDSKAPAGHNGGPVLLTVENVPCVGVHHHDGLLVARLDGKLAGRTVAEVEWETSFANNIATLAVRKNSVIMTSAYNQNRIARFDIGLDGATKVWEAKHPSKVCTPVIFDGHVYLAWRSIQCLDFESGKLKWGGERVGDAGSILITDDERIIVWGKKGDLFLVENANRSPTEFRLMGKLSIFRKTDAWPHVTAASDRLYVKDRGGNLACLKLR